jgi:hypothetical protein
LALSTHSILFCFPAAQSIKRSLASIPLLLPRGDGRSATNSASHVDVVEPGNDNHGADDDDDEDDDPYGNAGGGNEEEWYHNDASPASASASSSSALSSSASSSSSTLSGKPFCFAPSFAALHKRARPPIEFRFCIFCSLLLFYSDHSPASLRK